MRPSRALCPSRARESAARVHDAPRCHPCGGAQHVLAPIAFRLMRACVGCWPGPSPALMMGTLATAAAFLAAPAW